jgi:hypothetical protein
VFCKLAAISLNLRVLVAQVGVSMLGKILKITRLPAMSLLLMSLSALVVKENFGKDLPVLGSLPLTETGLPPKVTVEPVFLTVFFAVFFTDFFFALFAVFFFDAMVSPGHVVFGRPLRADCNVDAIKSAPTTHHW